MSAERVQYSVGIAERAFAVALLVVYSGAYSGFLERELGHGHESLLTDLKINIVRAAGYAVCLLLVSVGRRRIARAATRSLRFLLPVPLTFMSILWSSAPWITIFHCIALVGTVVVALYFASRYTVNQVLKLTVWALVVVAMGSAALALFAPALGRDLGMPSGPWIGLFGQKNALGRAMAVGTVVCNIQGIYSVKRIKWIIIGSGFLTVLIFSESMASMIGALVTIVVVWWCKNRAGSVERGRRPVLLMWASIVAVVCGLIIYKPWAELLRLFGRDVTLTGRVFIWQAVWPKILERPILGWGYRAFWRGWKGPSADVWWKFGEDYAYSHNGILEVLLQLGAVGLAAAVFSLINFGREALALGRREHDIMASWAIGLWVYVLVSNLAEANLLFENQIEWLLYTWTCFVLVDKRVVRCQTGV